VERIKGAKILGNDCYASSSSLHVCKRASKPSGLLDYDPTTDTTMVC
jgi:hypothetical protein